MSDSTFGWIACFFFPCTFIPSGLMVKIHLKEISKICKSIVFQMCQIDRFVWWYYAIFCPLQCVTLSVFELRGKWISWWITMHVMKSGYLPTSLGYPPNTKVVLLTNNKIWWQFPGPSDFLKSVLECLLNSSLVPVGDIVGMTVYGLYQAIFMWYLRMAQFNA